MEKASTQEDVVLLDEGGLEALQRGQQLKEIISTTQNLQKH